MKSVNLPLALQLDFLDEFKQAAKEAGLSTAATIRQSAKLGLPKFREQVSGSRVTNAAPLPDKVARKLYAEREEDMRFVAGMEGRGRRLARRGADAASVVSGASGGGGLWSENSGRCRSLRFTDSPRPSRGNANWRQQLARERRRAEGAFVYGGGHETDLLHADWGARNRRPGCYLTGG